MSVAAVAGPLASGSWAPGGVSAFHVPFRAPAGQVAHLVGWALEYVAPLKDWLDQLVGDEDRVAAFATGWRGASADLLEVERALASSDRRLDVLEGRTARALRKRYDEIRGLTRDTSEWTAASAAALELASTIVTAVHDAIVGALSELAQLVSDLFGFSLNPFDKVGDLRRLVDDAGRFIRVIRDLIERMFDAFGRLLQLLGALGPLIADALIELRALLGELLRATAPVVGGPVGTLLAGAVDDLFAKDPRVTELDPGVLTSAKESAAYRNAREVDSIGSIAELVQQNGYTDDMGGGARSVVDIKRIEDPGGGNPRWVVSLPSTQDWDALRAIFGDPFVDTLADYPATNDLDSNIALMLMDNPVLATQYERAVYQAMRDAGIPSDEPVVYTGFSQGGIMAANLASDPAQPYQVAGIITNGSPIDGFAIPPDVAVLSFQHALDPVPMLDGVVRDPSDPSQIPLPNPASGDVHNNNEYVASITDYAANHPGFDADFAFLYGDVVEHQQHTWSE